MKPDGRIAPLDYGKLAAALSGADVPFAKVMELDLSQARNAEEIRESGAAMLVLNPDICASSVYLQFTPGGYRFDLSKTRRIRQPFQSFYITNSAGSGTLQLALSRCLQFDIDQDWVQRVNIIAQQAAIDMNIAAQDADVDINIKAQNLGLALTPDWATQHGMDVTFTAITTGTFTNAITSYTVPAGKSLYICGVSAQAEASLTTHADLPQIVGVYLWDDMIIKAGCGGNGGCALPLPRPVLIPAGHTMKLYLLLRANHQQNGTACAWGYQL